MPNETEALYSKQPQKDPRYIGDCVSTNAPVATPEYVLREFFTYHPVREDQEPKYKAVRSAAKYFAEIVLQNTPRGADQSAAIRKIRESVMTANAAIALDGLSL